MPRPPTDLTFSYLGVDQNGETRLSLEEFNTIVRSHLTRIAKAQHSLQSAFIPLTKENCNVQPAQCKKAIKSLDEFNMPIQEFCKLFHKTQRLPFILTALRYQLLYGLHQVEEQTEKLVDLIDNYRAICTSSSQHAHRLHKEISATFEALLLGVADISQQAIFLDDEAKFQERKINSKLEEKPSTDNSNSDSPGHLYIVNQHEDGFDAS
jgi:hypothetical protein